jgi:hypothetical protein
MLDKIPLFYFLELLSSYFVFFVVVVSGIICCPFNYLSKNLLNRLNYLPAYIPEVDNQNLMKWVIQQPCFNFPIMRYFPILDLINLQDSHLNISSSSFRALNKNTSQQTSERWTHHFNQAVTQIEP